MAKPWKISIIKITITITLITCNRERQEESGEIAGAKEQHAANHLKNTEILFQPASCEASWNLGAPKGPFGPAGGLRRRMLNQNGNFVPPILTHTGSLHGIA